MTKIDMAFFPSVEGSMTSDDGQTFMLHVKRPTGGDLLLGFPHSEITIIIEYAAVQAAQGRKGKDETVAPLMTSSFILSRGPTGEPVLTMVVGRAGTISFSLPGGMPEQLAQLLQALVD